MSIQNLIKIIYNLNIQKIQKKLKERMGYTKQEEKSIIEKKITGGLVTEADGEGR